MKRNGKSRIVLIAAIVLVAAIGATGNVSALPNPAAVHCENRGYTYEIVNTDEGQMGVCILPNKNRCNAWDLYKKYAESIYHITREEEPAMISGINWRDVQGNWMTDVKDQGSCGACGAFSAVGALEVKFRINLNNNTLLVDLSEQDLVSCCPHLSCSGGEVYYALQYIQEQGVVDEPCFPYVAADVFCSEKCEDAENYTRKIIELKFWKKWSNETEIEKIKQELRNGPLAGKGILIFGNFYSYDGGIYEEVEGPFKGGHSMTLVGYKDTGYNELGEKEGYLIFKNSWGTEWGGEEGGYIKMGYKFFKQYPFIVYAIGPTDYDGDGVEDSGYEGDPYEPDNSFYQCSTMTVASTAQSQSRSITPAGDDDYIRFYAHAGRQYIFFTRGSTDTYGYLYNTDHTLLTSDDDSGWGHNFQISYPITSSGYYFLRVRGYYSSTEGPYILYYTYGDPYEPDNSFSQYSTMNVASTVQSQSRSIAPAGDNDYIRFYAHAGETYTFFTRGSTDTYGYLYNPDFIDQFLLTSDDDSGRGSNFQISYPITKSGYYFLRVRGYSSRSTEGPYILYYTYGDPYEPDPSFSQYSTMNVASTVQSQSRSIYPARDNDYIRFYAHAGRQYTFYTRGSTDTFCYLYNTDNTAHTPLIYDDDSGRDSNFWMTYHITSSGYYFLNVSGYSSSTQGPYVIHYIWYQL